MLQRENVNLEVLSPEDTASRSWRGDSTLGSLLTRECFPQIPFLNLLPLKGKRSKPSALTLSHLDSFPGTYVVILSQHAP